MLEEVLHDLPRGGLQKQLPSAQRTSEACCCPSQLLSGISAHRDPRTVCSALRNIQQPCTHLTARTLFARAIDMCERPCAN